MLKIRIALSTQVEDAKDFIKSRILQLVDQKQAAHKVGTVRLANQEPHFPAKQTNGLL